jgi:ADP-ribose pyrophosphatase
MSLNPPLSVFRFCTRCGAGKLAARSDREYQCEQCGFRHFINPISAVAVILSNREGELLLIRRARDPGRGQLGLPGGFVDPGETAEEALRREVTEEVGLTVTWFQYLTSVPNTYRFQEFDTPVLDLFFTAVLDSFAEARPLPEVQALEIVTGAALDLAEVAFRSNARALEFFLRKKL